jgi:MFS superfamily sulfate permease-like transporter
MTTMTLVLDEQACLKTIGIIADRMTDAAADHDDICLDLAAADNIDLSVLQVIESARRHAADSGARLTLAHPASPALTALLDRAGFLAAASPADITFWFHGELPQ